MVEGELNERGRTESETARKALEGLQPGRGKVRLALEKHLVMTR